MMVMTAKVNMKKTLILLGAIAAVIIALIMAVGGSDTHTFLFTVDSKVYINAFVLNPFFLHFFQVYKVVNGTSAVENIYLTVVCSVISYVVDNGTQRSDTDTACYKEKVLTLKFGFYRECSTVRATDSYLLANFHSVEPIGKLTALLNAEFHKFLVCRRRGNGEHTFAYAGNGNHCALTGHMFENLAAFKCVYSECLNIGSVDSDIGYNT